MIYIGLLSLVMQIFKSIYFLIELLIKKHKMTKYSLYSINHANYMVTVTDNIKQIQFEIAISDLYFNTNILHNLHPSEAYRISREYNTFKKKCDESNFHNAN